MFDKNTRILIVEDMSTMRKVIARFLRDLGYNNLADSPDGADAWKKIQEAVTAKQCFGLIISDWIMPKMKGLELLEKVRKTASIANTPFILLTAEAETDQIEIAKKAGADGYLLKPFNKDQLSVALTAVKNNKAA